MKTDIKEYIQSDLYRYYGNTKKLTFLKAFLPIEYFAIKWRYVCVMHRVL